MSEKRKLGFEMFNNFAKDKMIEMNEEIFLQ